MLTLLDRQLTCSIVGYHLTGFVCKETGMVAKVLVVEDDPRVAGLETEVLQTAGFLPENVVSGEEALRKLVAGTYDLVILNMKLAGRMSGLDVFRWMEKNLEVLPKVIFATGLMSEAEEAAVARAGCPVLRKPFRVEEFLRLVQQTLASQG